MRFKKNGNSVKQEEKTGWDLIIESGVIQLREAEAVAARLRVSIDHFEKRKLLGAPFPGEEKLREAGLI